MFESIVVMQAPKKAPASFSLCGLRTFSPVSLCRQGIIQYAHKVCGQEKLPSSAGTASWWGGLWGAVSDALTSKHGNDDARSPSPSKQQ